MNSFSATFVIKHEKNCPLYDEGEQLKLSEKTLTCPEGKEVCLILVRDLTALLFNFLQNQPTDFSQYEKTLFNCSGCKGLIKFALVNENDPETPHSTVPAVETNALEQALVDVLVQGEIFETLDRNVLVSIVRYTSRILLEHGSYLLQKGKENQNIYFVESGQLVIEDAGLILTKVGRGEICGEMSYLGGDIAISSVRAEGPAVVLAISGENFGRILGKNSDIQTYMAKLFASRLRKTAEARSREVASCMSGTIDEIVPAELLQVFHMHQKTGVLMLDLPSGIGRVCFREGQVVCAEYSALFGEAAIYKILVEQSGTYRFSTGLDEIENEKEEIADFMMLLMEGVRLADEEKERRQP